MSAPRAAIAGAAESARLGKVPELSALGLAIDASRRALDDAGLRPADIDGVATAGLTPYQPTALAHALGITPGWVDATMMGGCSSLMHVRHAAAAIAAGQCSCVLVAHGESGRSRIGAPGYRPTPDSPQGQFELPFGTAGPMTLLSLGALRFMHETGTTREQLAAVAVAQRGWAQRNPRALRREPLDVAGALAERPVAWPFTRPMCCVVTDGGGALIVTSAARARDLPRPPVYLLGSGEATGVPLLLEMPDLTTSEAFRAAGAAAFGDAGLRPADMDHAMLYDALAHLPLYALEDLGFVGRGEAGAFVAEGHTGPGGSLPLNTSGGGLSYTHTGMYGMFAIQESVRQLRGEAAAQVPGVRTSVAHGIGGMFQAAATLVLGREAA